MKQFQYILLGVFAFFILLGVLFFSGAIKIGNKEPTVKEQLQNKSLTIWGVFPREIVIDSISDFAQAQQMNLAYIEKSESTIDQEISEAIASGTGPDIVFAPHEVILKHQAKFVHSPYTTFSEREYRDLFIDQARLFALPDGIVAFPFLLDPLIFYYNRVSYNNAFLLNPPQTWQEVSTNSLRLTRKSGKETILESGFPSGSFANVPHLKDMISLLLIQAGNPVVYVSNDPNNLGFFSSLNQTATDGTPILSYVVEYIIQFTDPLKNAYSWNRAMPDARDAFASEQAAQYVGFASEIPVIARTNPSLNFDVAMIPQAENARVKKTFGRLYGMAVVKKSKEQYAAFQTVLLMKDYDFSNKLLNSFLATFPIAPVRKDLLVSPPGTQEGSIVFDSAIISSAWFDFAPDQSTVIFKELLNSVTRNTESIDDAVEQAHAYMDQLLK